MATVKNHSKICVSRLLFPSLRNNSGKSVGFIDFKRLTMTLCHLSPVPSTWRYDSQAALFVQATDSITVNAVMCEEEKREKN
jgi:hypothetical protein